MASQRIRGISIQITADNREFIDSFKKIDSAVKDTARQLRDVEKLLKLDPGNVELLTQKQNYLNTSIKDVNERLKLEREELKRLKDADQTPEVAKQQEALQRQIQSDQIELKNLQKELKDFGGVGVQQAKAVGDKFEQLGEKISDAGEKLTNAGTNLSRNVTLPVVAAGTAAVKTAADFDSSMAKVQAVSGASGEEMDKLREKALEMASSTKFTASEAADALYYMGLAGWKTDQMMEGLPAILNLSAASGEDLSMTSDIVTDALTAFGLTAADTASFVDVLAAASSNSNTTVAGMGEAFQYVAPVAGSLGYSIEDVSLALGVMANNGIKGSQAGAALRNILSRMAKPTKEVQTAMDRLGISMEDADGNLLSMGDLLDQLRDAFGQSEMPIEDFNAQIELLDGQLEDGTLTQEAYEQALEDLATSAYGVEGAEKAKLAAMLGGQRSMASILALVNTTAADYDKLSGAISGSAGAAERMSQVMLDNLGGQMTILKSQIEGVAIQMGDILVPHISAGVGKIQELVKAFSELDSGTKETIIQIAAIVAAVGPALIVVGKVITAIGSITSGIGGLIGLVAAHPLAAAIAGVVAVMAGAVIASQNYIRETYGLSEAERAAAEYAEKTAAAYDQSREARVNNNLAIEDSFGVLEDEWERLRAITDETGLIKEGYEEEAAYIVNHLNEALGTNITIKDGQIEKYKQLTQSIDELIERKKAEALYSANEEAYTEALKKRKEIEEQIASVRAEMTDNDREYNELLKEKAELESIATAEQIKLGLAGEGIANQYDEINRKLAALDNNQAKNRKTLASLNDSYGKYGSTIENMDDLFAAMQDGTADLSEAMQLVTYDIQRQGQVSDEALKEQYDTFVNTYNQMKAAAADKTSGISQEVVARYAKMVKLSAAELEKGGVVFNQEGLKSAREYIKGIENQKPKAIETSKTVARETAAGMGAEKKRYGEEGKAAGATYDQGLASNARNTQETGKKRAESGKAGAASVDYTSAGKTNGAQYDKGLSEGTSNTEEAGRKRAEAGKKGTSGVTYRPEGVGAAESYNEGVLGDIEATKRAAKKLPEAAKAEISKYDLETEGLNFGNGFRLGIEKSTPKVVQTSGSMVGRAIREVNYAMDAGSPSRLLEKTSGKWFDEGFAEGIRKNADVVEQAAAEMTLGAVGATEAFETMAGSYRVAGAGLLQGAGSTMNTTNNTNTYGDINITVNGAEGQDVNALADIIEDRMYRAVSRRQAVFA